MRRGKKSVAERVVYGAFDRLQEKNPQTDPVALLRKALDNVKPRLEVKSRRVGGANYQVPVEVAPDRQLALALRWMIDFADTRKGMPMSQALAQEISDAAAAQGNAVKKRDDTHKMAQANRAFAHLRW
jgi:small subunit ribosomal protein S7